MTDVNVDPSNPQELGVTNSIGAMKEREGPLVISLDGCALSVSTQFINRKF